MKRVRRSLTGRPDFEAPPSVGRPSKLNARNLGRIEVYCKLAGNPSYDRIALYIGVHKSTFQRWLQRYPELRFDIDCWRSQGLDDVRMVVGRKSRGGDLAAAKFHLEKTDPDYKRRDTLDVNVAPANYDNDAPPPDYV